MGGIEIDSGDNSIADRCRGLIVTVFHLISPSELAICLSNERLKTGAKYLADCDRITQGLQLCLELGEFSRVDVADAPAEQRLGTERDRVNHVFGERVLGEDLDEVVFAVNPHSFF